METLINKLKGLTSATEKSAEIMTTLFTPFVYHKRTLLATADHSDALLYYINSGLIRRFFILDGLEYTSRVMMESGFLLHKLNKKDNPSAEYIEFLEDTEGLVLNLCRAIIAAQEQPEIYSMLLEIYQDLIHQSNERELMLRHKSSDQNYAYLKQVNEQLTNKVPNDILASYLNISVKYLYTIKKRNRDK